MKICVLAGGLSPERDVSLSSGALIANALAKKGHTVTIADLFLGVESLSDVVWTTKAEFSYKIPEREPDIGALTAAVGRSNEIGPNIIELCASADVTFLALHGGIGENGLLQAVLSCAGIKYTGSDCEGCMLAMDKDLSKRLLRDAGIPTADWITRRAEELNSAEIIEKIGLPCVVKPLSCGSSVGVSLVRREEELDAALKAAAAYEDRVLIERLIEGREFSVGVLCGSALPPIEIRPKTGFYDYKNKYQSGLTDEICPADITPEQDKAARSLALDIHRCLCLGSYSRVDFILDEKSGEFICLEENALPGMTPISLLPQEAAAAGITYSDLCEMLARNAI